ncbi:MAG: CRISPR-associated ring nuclease Csm6 [Acetobacteraceae bacterium]
MNESYQPEGLPHVPHRFPSRVLFTVSGLTPQIVTETVYALAVRQTPAFVPTRIIVATTTEGAARVRLTLQGEDPGWLGRLCRDYRLPPIAFNEDDIRVLTGPDGEPLQDLRTEEENQAAADAITEIIRELTADPDCALHVSMAGGRKTLGFFAAYALSLYGRPQDRLSHVLVSEPFQNNPLFYYPTPYREVIHTRNNHPLNAAEARVTLAEIPFVRMRDGLSEALRSGRATYGQAVAAVQRKLEPPRLEIDLPRRRIIAGGVPVELRPQLLAVYVWLARKQLAGQTVVKGTKEEDTALAKQHAREFLAEYRQLTDRDIEATEISLRRNGLDHSYLSPIFTRLNDALGAALDVAAGPYTIKRFGPRMQSDFRIDLPPAAISITECGFGGP